MSPSAPKPTFCTCVEEKAAAQSNEFLRLHSKHAMGPGDTQQHHHYDVETNSKQSLHVSDQSPLSRRDPVPQLCVETESARERAPYSFSSLSRKSSRQTVVVYRSKTGPPGVLCHSDGVAPICLAAAAVGQSPDIEALGLSFQRPVVDGLGFLGPSSSSNRAVQLSPDAEGEERRLASQPRRRQAAQAGPARHADSS